jgi:hypothetical protein
MEQNGSACGGAVLKRLALRVVGCTACLLVGGAAVLAQSSAMGFVTRVSSPAEFSIGSLQVVVDGEAECGTAKHFFLMYRDYRKPPSDMSRPFAKRYAHAVPAACADLKVVPGSMVYVDGAGSVPGAVFHARDVVRFHPKQTATIQGGVLQEEDSALSHTAESWSGKLWVDGYPLAVTPETMLVAEPDGTTMRYRYRGTPDINVRPGRHSKPVSTAMRAALLKANTWVAYRAARAPDGSLVATELHFWPNRISSKEAAYLKRYAAAVTPADPGIGRNGTLQFAGETPIRIVANDAMQQYVAALGMKLVPQYQKELPDTDPTKIHFRFYVVEPFMVAHRNFFQDVSGDVPYYKPFHSMRDVVYNSPRPGKMAKDVLSTPDGTVLIPTSVVQSLHNEAQLAFLLSAAISTTVQKQGFAAWPLITGPHPKIINGIRAGDGHYMFSEMQYDQLWRISARGLVQTGYNPVDGAQAVLVARGYSLQNPRPFPRTWTEQTEVVDYMMNFVSQYYKAAEYVPLKTGAAEYAKAKLLLNAPAASAK